MAMHRLPAGTEGPRWRLLAAVWVFSAAIAVLLALALDALTDQHTVRITAPILALAIQWAAWLYLRDRPAQPRRYELEPEPDESPTIRLAAVEARPPDSGPDTGPHRFSGDLDLPAAPRHALREEPMPIQPKPTPFARSDDPNPAQAVLPADRFAPFHPDHIEAAAIAIQTARWDAARSVGSRSRGMLPSEAEKQWKALNRSLAEQVRREAFAALRAEQTWRSAHAGDASADFWNHQMERMIDWFNPPDEDAACESICMDAVERAYKFAESQPCQCVGREEEHHAVMVCRRCIVLGRIRDTEVQR